MFELNKVSLTLGCQHLLDHASVRVECGYRVGLIGKNGAGKSSLINMLLGKIQEDSGSCNLAVSHEDIAYLEQSLPQTDLSALEYAQGGDKQWFAIDQRLKAAESDDDGMAVAECYDQIAAIDGYTITARAAKILTGLCFTDDNMHNPVSSFSGGWQMRLQLARVLLSRSDFLLLDEPTNHLDIDAIMWLESWLNKNKLSFVLISHDRDFLDNVTSHSLHLSHRKLKLYTGNYTSFAKQYAMQLEIETRQAEKVSAQRAHMQSFVDRFKAKASKAKQAQSRVKALEKLSFTAGLMRESEFNFNFLPIDLIKGSLLTFAGDVGYSGESIVSSCRVNVGFSDRIGIIGKNGEGKTTLLKTLAGKLPPVDGELNAHSKINLGYFSQQQLEMLDLDSTPLQSLQQSNKQMREAEARKFLGGFNFIGDRVFDSVRNFSGGEKARLALAILISHKPNLLLLDEPTNHLDMQMREAFICALQNFTGGVILVSHDRYFMTSIVDEVWSIANGSLKQFYGDLDDYKKVVLNEAPSEVGKQKKTETLVKEVVLKKTAKVDIKRVKKIEARIVKAESNLQALELRLTETDLYLDENKLELHDVVVQHQQAKEKLQLLEEQWLAEQE
jgi:ATP-binding cassette, subfamily F, member 3